MTLHQANQLDALLEKASVFQSQIDDLQSQIAELRAALEADNSGEEWKDAE